jgi:nitroreductase
MDAISALHQRVSTPRLIAPAPTPEQLEVLFKAAIRAADHGNMRPWRFLVIEGEGLVALGKVFADAAIAKNPQITTPELERCHAMPQRAPMIVVPGIRLTPRCRRSNKLLLLVQRHKICSMRPLQRMLAPCGARAIWRMTRK